MSEETKRLLKYDLLCSVKDILIFGLIMLALQLWCYYMYQTVANAAFLAAFVIGMPIIVWGVKDWQTQIRLYVSSGMTRKGIFQVLLMRYAMTVLAGLMMEAAIVFIGYPELGMKFLLLSGFFLLFLWGFGEIAGVLAYQGKKLGQVLMLIGYMMVGMICAGSVFTENQMEFWYILLDELTVVNVLVVGIAALAVLAGGIFFAKKQMGKYMVY